MGGARRRGWNWDGVLPYFKKIERDEDFDGPYHGKDGHIPVRRIFQDKWTGHARAVAKACEEAGYPYLPDQNGEFVDGHFPITISNSGERRVSAAMGYLNADVRKRPNLTISTDTQVAALLFEGTACVGVRAIVAGKEVEFRGREIILSCGAIHSPAHLMRAGIGPVGQLHDLGIPVVAALPGVGQRLMDHPSIALASFLRPDARVENAVTRRHLLVGLRYSSGMEGIPKGDMFVAMVGKSAWHAIGEQIASFLIFINKTYSETGQVKLASRDWRAEPVVEFNLLSDKRDLDRLMSGFRKMAALQESAPMRAVASDPFPASYGDRVKQVGAITLKNKVLTAVGAKLLDGPAALRRHIIEKYVLDGFSYEQVMNDDDALESFVKKAAVGVWHASCTCRMGRADDPMAVTDNSGRVRGVQGLRVVDASLFPVVPCANTNFPTFMTAEKIADAVLAGH
ncbi:MAG: GMC family oxidoreductase N-terminal domain-containing protein [Rhodospirillales bacterium]|nr:MAG: GMC family oxidoreductase N-terminal domain-containing protein [Rhodospirillales bacterium]